MHLLSFFSVLIGVTSRINAAAIAERAQSPTAGVEALLKRRLPQHVESFEFRLDEKSQSLPSGDLKDTPNDLYVVSSTQGGKIQIHGNSPSALLSGLHSYLSDVAHVDIWWYVGSQLDDAPTLPKLSAPITGSSTVPYRYHFNTVTTSYTSAFWSWEDWELQLDWMALRGVNLALAWIGVEHIFIEMFRDVGLTDAEISTFLSGPAFLAWNHFGNIQGSWGGNLPDAWVSDQFALQKMIVKRMVELGMTPILPAFPGYVPRAITRVFPDVKVSNGSDWERFPTQFTGDTFVDPFDPVFEKLQKLFIQKQNEAYGNVTKFYTLDQFNENNPMSDDLDYLHNVSVNTWKTLKAADPQSIWVMQGWLFVSNSAFWTNDKIEAFLKGVPNTDMLIIDLASESTPQWQRTDSYYGKSWLWCEIHDYGGNMGLYGQIDNVTINSVDALAESDSLVGYGLTMEGQEGNEVMYDLMLSQAWSQKPIDTLSYFHSWVSARYSLAKDSDAGDELYAAWETLRTTVFNNVNLTANASPKSIMEFVPSTSGLVNRTGHHPTKLSYDPASMVEGWKHLFKAAIKDISLLENPSFHYDMVDWTRQVLANAFIPLYEHLVAIYNTPHISSKCRAKGLRKQGGKMIRLMQTLNDVLSTDKNFRLDTWIDAARASAGSDDKMADFLEYEARNQITLWGPTGQISDYASKSWSGLVSTYYIPRWEMFVEYLAKTEPAAYNQTAFDAEILAWELAWVNEKSAPFVEEEKGLGAVLNKVVKEWHDVFG